MGKDGLCTSAVQSTGSQRTSNSTRPCAQCQIGYNGGSSSSGSMSNEPSIQSTWMSLDTLCVCVWSHWNTTHHIPYQLETIAKFMPIMCKYGEMIELKFLTLLYDYSVVQFLFTNAMRLPLLLLPCSLDSFVWFGRLVTDCACMLCALCSSSSSSTAQVECQICRIMEWKIWKRNGNMQRKSFGFAWIWQTICEIAGV